MTWRSQQFGVSFEGRPLVAWVAPERTTRHRVLIVGGQHGDERRASRAVARLLAADPSGYPCDLALVPALNPDGLARRARANAMGLDLNRDHLLLLAPETRALHAFIRAWAPHVIVDAHNFPSRRSQLLAAGVTLGWHVCVDVATHPAAQADLSIVDRVSEALTTCGLRASRYTLLRPDGLSRHSSPHPHDLRNAAALRYQATTVLLEGRAPTREDDRHERRRLRDAFDMSLRTTIAWAAERSQTICAEVPQPGQRIPVGWQWRGEERPASFPVWNVARRRVDVLPVRRFAPQAEPRRRIRLPEAYAVPASARRLVTLLDSHQFDRTHDGGWLVVPIAQRGGRALAVLLERRSCGRIGRHPGYQAEFERVRPVTGCAGGQL